MKYMRRLAFLFQILIVAVVAGLFAWTLWKNVIPNGVFEATYDFDHVSPFITSLLPGERALPITRGADRHPYQAIIGDPVYFRLRPPRTFDSATVTVEFQNATQPILEVGGLANRNPDIFDLQPLENTFIDSLPMSKTADGDLTLYQSKLQYASIADFLKNPPPRDKIATYHARVDAPFHIPTYVPSDSLQTIDTSLRGSHTFSAYVKNETLDVSFSVQDMNRDAGGDPITITAFQGSNPVGTVSEPDDGVVVAGGKSNVPHVIHLAIPGLPEDAYRIEFRTTRDVFIRHIATRSKKFVVLNDLFLGDESGYRDGDHAVQVWTTATTTHIETLHAGGGQELHMGNDLVRIAEPFRTYTHRTVEPLPTVITSPRGDIIIRSSGVFAWSQNALFVPEPIRMDTDFGSDTDIQYVLARYTSGTVKGNVKTATAHFDLTKLMWEGNSIPFVISAPHISDLQNEVRIRKISVRFERPKESLLLSFKKIFAVVKGEYLSKEIIAD